MTRAREEQIIEAAYKEAKARGLPDGWTCSIDVSLSLESRSISPQHISIID